MKRGVAISLGLILGLAAVLRFWGIAHQVWTDENKAVSPSVAMVADGALPLWSVPVSRYPHFSHYVFAWAFWAIKLLGNDLTGEQFTVVARAIGAAVNVATVAAVFGLGRRLADTKTGLLAAALLAVTPLHVTYSHYAHVELPGVIVMLLAVWAALHVWDRGEPKWYVITGLLTGVAGATQFWAFAIGAGLLLAHARHVVGAHFSLKSIFRPAFLAGLACIPIGFFLVSPFSLVEKQNWNSYHDLSLRGTAGDLGHTRPHIAWPLYTTSPDWAVPFTSAGLVWEVGLVVSLLALVGVGVAAYRKDWRVVVLLGVLLVLLYVAIAGGLRLYAVKRLIFLPVLLALLAAYGVRFFPKRWLGYGLFGVAFLVNGIDSAGVVATFGGVATHPAAVRWAEANIPRGRVVLQNGPLKLLEPDSKEWKVVRMNEVYANFHADDPEVAHDRAKTLEEWTQGEGVDFIVLDSRMVDRYYDRTSKRLYPETTASYRAFYDDVRARGKLVYKIEPELWRQAGARVEIYDVRRVQ